MKSRFLAAAWRITAGLPIAAAACGGAAHATPVYAVTDLGSLGFGGSRALGLSSNSKVVGRASTGTTTDGFLYSNGAMTDLGANGGVTSYASAVNAAGQVAGAVYPNVHDAHAFLYSNGVMADLGTLGGASSAGAGINNSGQVVGSSSTATGDVHAFLYSGGRMTDLGAMNGGSSSGATAINAAGQITGSSTTRLTVQHAFLYSAGVYTDLGTLGGSYSFGTALNDKGQVVGYSYTAGGRVDAFLYSNGTMTDLGNLGGSSIATSVNNAGAVVGYSSLASNGAVQHAFLYDGTAMTDLDTLVASTDPLFGRVTFDSAMGINDAGQIVANGCYTSGACSAFLLSVQAAAVPEPASLALLGMGVAGIAAVRRRRASSS